MPGKEASILICDSKNSYQDWNTENDQLNIVNIERSHEYGLHLVKETKPSMLAKVIHEDDDYTFEDTVEFLKSAKQLSRDTRLLVINPVNEKEKIYQLIDIGVDGFCDGKSVQLAEALKYMQQYPVYISYIYQKALVEEFRSTPETTRHSETILRVNKLKAREMLTKREVEVVEDLIMEDGNSEQRASRLFISPKTYKNHIASIMDKLCANNRTHIIPIAIKKGIIETVFH